MVRAVSATEANQNFSRLLREVQEGESFVILSRGRPVARLAPVDEAGTSQAVDELLAYLRTQPRRTAGAWTRDDLYP
jgi:prevent-host-death family protein